MCLILCCAESDQLRARVVNNNGNGTSVKTVKSNETPGNYDRVHDLGLGSNVVVLSLGDDGRTVPAVNNNGGSPESKRDTSGVLSYTRHVLPSYKMTSSLLRSFSSASFQQCSHKERPPWSIIRTSGTLQEI